MNKIAVTVAVAVAVLPSTQKTVTSQRQVEVRGPLWLELFSLLKSFEKDIHKNS